jgi:membrane associated rhomboid family serine protease
MLYDRHYMREPDRRRDVSALAWIIGVIVVAFVVQKIAEGTESGPAFVGDYLTLSRLITKGYVWTLFTYGFLHADLLHVLLNSLGIYLLGRTLLPIMGVERMVGFLFGSMALGGLVWTAIGLAFGFGFPVIGISAACCGLLAVFCTLYPEQRIGFLLIPWTVKAKHMAWAFTGISLAFMIGAEIPGRFAGGYAHSAHLGGMLAGWLYGRFLHHRTGEFSLRPSIELPAWMRRRKKIKAHVVPDYTVNVTPPPQNLRAEVDRILDKINISGFGSLTDDERRVLEDAGDLLNKR